MFAGLLWAGPENLIHPDNPARTDNQNLLPKKEHPIPLTHEQERAFTTITLFPVQTAP